jgi:hypothetical protein
MAPWAESVHWLAAATGRRIAAFRIGSCRWPPAPRPCRPGQQRATNRPGTPELRVDEDFLPFLGGRAARLQQAGRQRGSGAAAGGTLPGELGGSSRHRRSRATPSRGSRAWNGIATQVGGAAASPHPAATLHASPPSPPHAAPLPATAAAAAAEGRRASREPHGSAGSHMRAIAAAAAASVAARPGACGRVFKQAIVDAARYRAIVQLRPM